MKIYFKSYVLVAQLLTVVFPLLLFAASIANYMEGDFIGSIICSVATLFWLPIAAITVGTLKYKGMQSMLVDLSRYEFSGETLGEDVQVADEKLTILHNKYDKIKAASPSNKSILGIARQMAIDNDYSPKEYFALLSIVFTEVGKTRSVANDTLSSHVRDKIEEIKRRFKQGISSDKPSDKPGSGGKYSFL